MSELVAFLRARFDEDEGRASRREAIGRVSGRAYTKTCAEMSARRRIVSLHAGHHECVNPTRREDAGYYDGLCDTLRLLAVPYADHPDYREEWKP